MSLFGDLSINGCDHPPSGGKESSKNYPSKKFKRLGAQQFPFSEIQASMAVTILPPGARHLQKMTPPNKLSAWELNKCPFSEI